MSEAAKSEAAKSDLPLKTLFVARDAGADEALEKLASTKNPFAAKAALAVTLPSGKPAGALECRDAKGQLLGIWPMNRSHMLAIIPVMRTPNLPLYETASTPMIAAGREEEVLESFIHALQNNPDLSKTVFAQSMRMEGAVWEALETLATRKIIRLTTIESWERSVMKRDAAPNSQSYLLSQVSYRKRKTFRRKMRKLQFDGELELLISDDAKAITQAFDRFCHLEASGWKGKRGTALLQHPKDAAYFRALMSNMAAANRGFIAEAWLNDRAIASGLFLISDDEIIFLRTAYEADKSAYSPGVILDALLTTELYARANFALLDSSTDGTVLAESMLWPQRRKMAHLVIDCGGGSAGAFAITAMQHARLWLKRKKNGLTKRSAG